MKRIKENQKNQGILFSTHYVGDRLSDDHPVHLFDRLIDKLDISAITSCYSREGGSMFSPRDHLTVLVYAYFHGISSSIKISEYTNENLAFMFLSGGYHIKSRTIRSFRSKHKEALRLVFSSSIILASEIGLVDLSDIFAIDGSKFEANAGFSKTLRKREWEDRQSKILENVDEFLSKWETQDELEENLEEERRAQFKQVKDKLERLKHTESKKSNVTKKQPDEVLSSPSDKSNRKNKSKAVERKKSVQVKSLAKAEKLLNEYEKTTCLLGKHEDVQPNSFLSLTDPDCRIMKNGDTKKESYNVQIVTNNQVIVAADVTQDENDQAQLKPMTEQLKDNLDISSDSELKLVADAGYNKGENLAYLDKEAHIDSYVSMHKRSEKETQQSFPKENFTFNEDDESWLCPEGEKLEFIKEHIKDNKHYTLYGCREETCLVCKNYSQCVTTRDDKRRGYRTIDDDQYIIYRKEMKEKMSKTKSKQVYKKRGSNVEAVFGQIKGNRGFRRFCLRGLQKVKTEFILISIAHNLGKIMNKMREKPELALQYRC